MIQVVLLNLIQVDILMTERWVQSVILDKIGLPAAKNELDIEE